MNVVRAGMYVCIIFISLKHGYTFMNEKKKRKAKN